MRSSRPLSFVPTAVALACLAVSVVAGTASAQAPLSKFVNFESPHVHPLDVTPDGTKLLAVNTADNRLEVYAISGGALTPLGSIPVGYDPVTVRARTNAEAWVVNHVSDSLSIVDLNTFNVKATIKTSDEPCDVVFAGLTGLRAFVSCQSFNTVQVFDPSNLAAAPQSITILGERPRALAVSPDRTKVYCAIFESGNKTTILGGGATTVGGAALGFPPNVVSDATGPYAGMNPPPNAGAGFSPPRSAGAAANLPVGLIVRKDDQGRWMDDNAHDWTNLVSGANASRSGRPVGWDLYDHDCAIIDAGGLGVTYSDGLMNLCMALGVNPVTGYVTVVGTEALNQIRYEPNVKGVFIRVESASFHPTTPLAATILDLNPHLNYVQRTIPQNQRDLSLGDPRGIVYESTGLRGFVSGMGSNNVVAIDAGGQRMNALPPIPVGEGPTGLALSESQNRLFVLNRFAGSISVIDTQTLSETARVPFHDATPTVVKSGRKHLFDTHKNSGLGQIACASCHVDARTDRLAWDLGDPTGVQDPLTSRNLGYGIPGLTPATAAPSFSPFHPMKGPMTTQTFQDIVGKEPFHWRGDRLGLEDFNAAFIGLQGDDTNLTGPEMQEFEDFLATVTLPPNPFRNFDNTLSSSLPLPGHFTVGQFGPAGLPLPNGNANNGLSIYRSTTRRVDRGAFACVTCHTLPTGLGPDATFSGGNWVAMAVGPRGEHHIGMVSVDGSTNTAIKVPQTRQIYKKVGFNTTQTRNTSGFGVLHDGSVDSIERFVSEPAFTLASNQEVADMVAFMLSLSGSDLPAGTANNIFIPPGVASKDARASVGVQLTLASGTPDAASMTLLNQMISQAALNRVGLIVKGVWAAGGSSPIARGAYFVSGTTFQTDRSRETLSQAQLLALAGPGSEITFTVVPSGVQQRLGVDRDSDGFFDRDELDVCSDPANPVKFPGSRGSIDYNGDLSIDPDDLADFIAAFFTLPPDPKADFNGDGAIDPDDLADFISGYFGRC